MPLSEETCEEELSMTNPVSSGKQENCPSPSCATNEASGEWNNIN